MPRQPHRNKELAPWAARRFRQQSGGLIENFDHIWVEKRHKLQHPSYGSAGTGNWRRQQSSGKDGQQAMHQSK
eukprot:scaffold6546_cov214-Alexandrium_tamarense.AAC.1